MDALQQILQDPTQTNISNQKQTALKQTYGKNRSQYNWPISEHLASGALPVLQSLLNSIPFNDVIFLEHVTVDSITKHYKT